MSDPKQAAVNGVSAVVDALKARGVDVQLTPEQLELIGEGVVAVVDLISKSAVKKAAAAGAAAAAAVETVEQANAVLEAAAAAVESP